MSFLSRLSPTGMIFPQHRERGTHSRCAILVLILLTCGLAGQALGVELEDAQKLYKSGKYEDCITQCVLGINTTPWDDGWWLLRIRAEMMTGKYPEALRTLQTGLARLDTSIALRLEAIDVLRANNRAAEADRMLMTIRQLALQNPQRYANPQDRVVLGEALLRSGADPRQVLELFYDNAKNADPRAIEPYFATGELALQKQDFALAAESYLEATKRAADDPDAFLGLARAYENNPEQATAALDKALELNPRHVPSLLFQIDNAIDQESYDQAETIIKQVLAVNPKSAKALAYRAILAHLNGDRAKEQLLRSEALASWPGNPEVDYTIGQKIAQKYRFAEGSEYQRQALKLDPNYLPAKLELCQDLLRLGQEDEGWKLANEVFKQDQYNVLAYNLSTLHDSINKYKTFQNEHFIVRMDPREADIYGQNVLALLEQARATLTKKYDVQLPGKITVEVFNQQKDFAIRTFGLPGGAGFLGVCFGPVVTVNSPATRGANPTNWEAVVWHEFCHAVTLSKTKNKMPRWLSEGISVYEERQQDKSWGQIMNPQYRDFILKDGATPVSQLSGAFLKPKSAMHLMFAYYESNMAVEYIVDRFGMPALQKVLIDLGNDVPINAALAKYTEPIDKLDTSFNEWLKVQAQALAPRGDIARPTDLPLDGDSAEMAAWNKDHPDNFWGLLGEGRALLAERKFAEALVPLKKSVEICPTYAAAGGPYLLLAAAYKELGQTPQEREALEKHVALTGDAFEPRMRLIEIALQQNDWKGVKTYTDQVLAINPLVPAPHRYLAQVAEHDGDRALAITAHRTILMMNPLDVADQHYRLAQLFMEDKNQLPEAKRQVLMALEQAPRFTAAHKLLLEIASKLPAEAPATAPSMPPLSVPATAPSELR
jgi:tetratricopeptide (TPR) repeat protein